MNWLKELSANKNLHTNLSAFLDQHGISGLEDALQLYNNTHQKYICKTKESISQINIYDIYYLEIRKHNITIHAQHETYQKYGTLSNELKALSPYGFVKCTQSCIVSLSKIKSIRHDDIILINDVKLHMSRKYASHILIAFSQYKPTWL